MMSRYNYYKSIITNTMLLSHTKSSFVSNIVCINNKYTQSMLLWQHLLINLTKTNKSNKIF